MTLKLGLLIAAAALVLSACGSDDESEETVKQETATQSVGGAPIGASARDCQLRAAGFRNLRATGVDCATAVRIMVAWDRPRCRPAEGTARSQCTVSGYRCQAIRANRGLAVSCAQPGRSISFLRRR